MIGQLIRSEPNCYFASGDYAESLWGKFGYIYEGRGSLELSTEEIALATRSGLLTIPFESIKLVSLTRFSSWSKPFDLSRLTILYQTDCDLRTIHLVPFRSAFDPVWTTSEIVEDWYETLGEVEALSGRVAPSPSRRQGLSPNTRPLIAIGIGIAIGAALAVGLAMLAFVILVAR